MSSRFRASIQALSMISMPEASTRPGDVRVYLTDSSKVRAAAGWKPRWTVERIVESIVAWIRERENELRPVLGENR